VRLIRFITISIISGFLFGMMDGFVNANPLAMRLFQVFKPIAKESINIPAGVAIDLVYGFVMTGIFLILYKSLPGSSGLAKGTSYGLLVWFFRVVMYAVTNWMMFNVSSTTLSYMLVAGLGEMLVLGLFYGLTLKPAVKS
jgi:hypothetical protein